MHRLERPTGDPNGRSGRYTSTARKKAEKTNKKIDKIVTMNMLDMISVLVAIVTTEKVVSKNGGNWAELGQHAKKSVYDIRRGKRERNRGIEKSGHDARSINLLMMQELSTIREQI